MQVAAGLRYLLDTHIVRIGISNGLGLVASWA
jgi:hypothetical protein